jgi:hypothetical protein
LLILEQAEGKKNKLQGRMMNKVTQNALGCLAKYAARMALLSFSGT